MCSLQPERGVGTHCVVEFMCKELTADMNPKKILLSSRQVPSCIRACGMQVESHVSHCRVNWPVLPFKQFTVEEHCEVGDAWQARDGFIARCLQKFCRGGVLHLFLLVAFSHSLCLWLVELSVEWCGREFMKALSFGDCLRGWCCFRSWVGRCLPGHKFVSFSGWAG